MIGNHLSEYDIQQYVLERETCAAALIGHLETCALCRTRASNYSMLFTEVSQTAMPAVEADLAELVLAQLPGEAVMSAQLAGEPVREGQSVGEAVRPARVSDPILYLLLISAGALILISCWFFRKLFLNIMQSSPSFALYFIIGVSLIVLLLRALKMFRTFQRQLKDLKFS